MGRDANGPGVKISSEKVREPPKRLGFFRPAVGPAGRNPHNAGYSSRGTHMALQAFGIVGMEVMGKNIALNIEEKGFPIAVYNRTVAKAEEFKAENAAITSRSAQPRRVLQTAGEAPPHPAHG